MAGEATRTLLLGAVALFGPANGYQVRRELLSWRVDQWAHVNPGSIYHGLSSLARDGLLVRHDLVDGTREVAVYEITPPGREQLEEMLLTGLRDVDLHDRTMFAVAFSQLPLLRYTQALEALEERHRSLESLLGEVSVAAGDPPPAPPHAVRMQDLWVQSGRAELAWLTETLRQVRAGEVRFSVADGDGWVPPDDDPGWVMQRDRERYLGLLGRS